MKFGFISVAEFKAKTAELEAQVAELTELKEALAVEEGASVGDAITALVEERDEVTRERDAANAERDTANTERDALQAQVDKLNAEREAIAELFGIDYSEGMNLTEALGEVAPGDRPTTKTNGDAGVNGGGDDTFLCEFDTELAEFQKQFN